MRLGDNVEMVLGTCMSNDDPLKLGRIKVGAPGYFDRTVMMVEAIPWAYPLTMSSNQSYSTIAEGSKVWLIDNKENCDEFWYIPFHELNDDTKQAIGSDVDSDVLFSRNVAGKLVQLYQNDTEGIVLRQGPSTVTLGANGAIRIESDGIAVVIEGKTVFMGDPEAGTKIPLANGDQVYNALASISSNLSKVAASVSIDPYAGQLAKAFVDMKADLDQYVSKVKSDIVTVSS